MCSNGANKDPKVSKSLSYCWLKRLTDLEFKHGNLEMGRYRVIYKENYRNLMVFLDFSVRGQSST